MQNRNKLKKSLPYSSANRKEVLLFLQYSISQYVLLINIFINNSKNFIKLIFPDLISYFFLIPFALPSPRIWLEKYPIFMLGLAYPDLCRKHRTHIQSVPPGKEKE